MKSTETIEGKVKGDRHSREQFVLLSILFVLFLIFIKTIRVAGILNIFLIGQGQDINSIEVLLEILLLVLEGPNLIIVGLMIAFGMIYYFRILGKGWLRKNVITVMNVVIYVSAISFFVERMKPLFFTVPLFFMVAFRLFDMWTSDKKKLVKIIKHYRVPILFFLLLYVLYFVGIIQIQSGIAHDSRASIPIFQQIISFTPVYHASIYFLVLILNDWGSKEFENFIKVILFFGVLLFLESLLAFYFKVDGLVDVSLGFGMFQGAFLAGYHKVARLAMTIGFFSLFIYSRELKKYYLLIFLFSILISFSTLNRSAVGAFFVGMAIILVQLFYLHFPHLSVRQKNRIGLVFFVVILILGVLMISLTGQVRNEIVGQEINVEQLVKTLTGRIILMARGVEIFMGNFWIGTGAQNVSVFLAAEEIPIEFSLTIQSWLYELVGKYMDVVSSPEIWLREFFTGRTIHNLWLNFILEWGITGLLIVGGIIYGGTRWIRIAWKFIRSGDKRIIPFGIMLAYGFSLSMSMLFTIIFRYYSLFVVIILLTGVLAHDFELEMDALEKVS